jgi:hypothetical protein
MALQTGIVTCNFYCRMEMATSWWSQLTTRTENLSCLLLVGFIMKCKRNIREEERSGITKGSMMTNRNYRKCNRVHSTLKTARSAFLELWKIPFNALWIRWDCQESSISNMLRSRSIWCLSSWQYAYAICHSNSLSTIREKWGFSQQQNCSSFTVSSDKFASSINFLM